MKRPSQGIALRAGDGLMNLLLSIERHGVAIWRIGISHRYRGLAAAAGLDQIWDPPSGLLTDDAALQIARGIERLQLIPDDEAKRLLDDVGFDFGFREGLVQLLEAVVAACREHPECTLLRMHRMPRRPADLVPPYARHRREMTHAQWCAEGERLFGPDMLTWRFICPSCGHVAAAADWKAIGAREGEVAFACIGRHLPDPSHLGGVPPCNYTGGGLFGLNPINVRYDDGRSLPAFAFALTGDERARADNDARAARGS